MSRALHLLAIALLVAARPLGGHEVTRAEVLPERPTSDEPVRLRLEGWLSDGCPRSLSASVEEKLDPQGGSGRLVVMLEVSSPPPGAGCPDVLTPFALEVEAGFPAVWTRYAVEAVIQEGDDRREFPDLASFVVELGQEEGIVGVTLAPPEPTAADLLSLRVHGLVIACLVETRGLRTEIDSSRSRLVVVMRIYIPPLLCPGRPIQFRDEAALGALPAGRYEVDVILEASGDYSGPTSFPGAGSFEVLPAPGPLFLRGDSTGNGVVDISDPLFTLFALFAGGPLPPCPDAADADDDGQLDLADPLSSLEWLFRGGAEPRPPGPYTPGPDPTTDGLDCAVR